MTIDYDHLKNTHSLAGPQAAIPLLFRDLKPASLLDVGCGVGTWLRAAYDLGIADVLGVDGVDIPEDMLLIPKNLFNHFDFTQPLRLGRRFDVALCLEVAEHLEPNAGALLITSLTEHADTIFFSAACPGQAGQHHLNCQWPAYWQTHFNTRGFVCDDNPRWRIWNIDAVEPWYRQNLFVATRSPMNAGKETRIKPVIHPKMLKWILDRQSLERHSQCRLQIEQGSELLAWYVKTPVKAFWHKLARRTLTR